MNDTHAGLDPIPGPRRPEPRAWTWLVPAALLVLEVLALQARFTTAPFGELQDGWSRVLPVLRELPRLALMALTALVVLGHRTALGDLARLRGASRHTTRRAGWIVLQLGVFAALWAATQGLLEHPAGAGRAGPLLLATWFALALLALLSCLRATAQWTHWRTLLHSRSRLLGCALGVGLLAWLAGFLSQTELRELLRLPTLRVAYVLLAPFTDGAFVSPRDFEFGTARFTVNLAPECSGLDGIGLAATFIAAWLVWMRRELRFPRALWLLPIGVCATWLLNAARLAALVLIGERASGAAAVAGFHSVAGLVLFCTAAIATVGLGHAEVFQNRRAGRATARLDATTAYLLPLMVWIGVGLLAEALPIDARARLGLRLGTVGAVLFVARRQLGQLLDAPSVAGWTTALLGALCIWALPGEVQQQLFVARDGRGAASSTLAFAATVLVAPLVEELAFRGYLLRRPAGAHFEQVPARAGGARGLALSALLFGLLHPAWFAGLAFGLLFGAAYLWRGRLSDAWLAHTVTNLTLFAIAR